MAAYPRNPLLSANTTPPGSGEYPAENQSQQPLDNAPTLPPTPAAAPQQQPDSGSNPRYVNALYYAPGTGCAYDVNGNQMQNNGPQAAMSDEEIARRAHPTSPQPV